MKRQQEIRNGLPMWWVYVKSTTVGKHYWLDAATLKLAKACATADHLGRFGGDLEKVQGGKFYGGGA